MMDDMSILRTSLSVAHSSRPKDSRTLADVVVDTGSEYNWIPRDVLEELGVDAERVDTFETADGRVLNRPVGFARIYAGGRSAVVPVVFADADDMILLGAVGLESLNLRVDLGRRELVAAGPMPVAVA